LDPTNKQKNKQTNKQPFFFPSLNKTKQNKLPNASESVLRLTTTAVFLRQADFQLHERLAHIAHEQMEGRGVTVTENETRKPRQKQRNKERERKQDKKKR
jgi:hypothetical protein